MLNAMAPSESNSQALREYKRDDARKSDKRGGMMGSSAGLRAEAWNASFGDDCEGRHDSTTSTLTSATRPFRWRQSSISTSGAIVWLMILGIWIMPASTAFVHFQNCLTEDYQTAQPLRLQFIPLFVNAVFDTKDLNHNLTVTVYGNVNGTGPIDLVKEPDANNTDYWHSNQTQLGGKIEKQPDPTVPFFTTLFSKVNVLTYEPFNGPGVDFCASLQNGFACPLGPVFASNITNLLVYPLCHIFKYCSY